MPQIEFNDAGRRIGEGHPRARYTNAEVLVIQRLAGVGIERLKISKLLKVPYVTVRSFVSGRRRCQTAARWESV